MAGRKDLASRGWKAQSARVVARDGMCCDCGTAEDLTADHIEAFEVRKQRLEEDTGRTLGDLEVSATYGDDELITRCRPCNSRKGARVGVRLDYRAEGWFDPIETRLPVF